jgi:hypothetical protein
MTPQELLPFLKMAPLWTSPNMPPSNPLLTPLTCSGSNLTFHLSLVFLNLSFTFQERNVNSRRTCHGDRTHKMGDTWREN